MSGPRDLAAGMATTRKRRIAFVCDSVMPWRKGGRERRLYEIARRLAREDQEAHIYTMKWWSGADHIVHEGLHYHALCRSRDLYAGGRRSTAAALFFALSTFKLVFEDFDALDVDQMPFFPLFSARVVAWIKRRKLVATWHEVWNLDYWRSYAGARRGLFAGAVEWLAIRTPDVIVANSRHTAARLVESGAHCHVETVPLGVDFEAIAAAPPAVSSSDVIYVGRLISHKNVDVLVEALSLLKSEGLTLRATLVGGGPDEARLNQMVRERGLEADVSILGEVDDNAHVFGLMKSSKLLVLPSAREGFGLVALEARAAGIPVVTVRCPDNAAQDLVAPGVNGEIAELNAASLAAAIRDMLNRREAMRPGFGLEQYDWRIAAEKVEACLFAGGSAR
jgi:glycosyltransferase involved in cell wall biosynthesis